MTGARKRGCGIHLRKQVSSPGADITKEPRSSNAQNADMSPAKIGGAHVVLSRSLYWLIMQDIEQYHAEFYRSPSRSA